MGDDTQAGGAAPARPKRKAAAEPEKPALPPQAQPLGDVIRHHPIVVITSTVTAVLAAILAGMWGIVGFINNNVDQEVERRMGAEREALFGELNERAVMTMVYAVKPDGEATGQLTDLQDAIEAGRTIFVRYTRQGQTNDGTPYKTEWFRACHSFSFDYVSGESILTCFVLRLPDTDITLTGRTIGTSTEFEDYAISTSGTVRWRKYAINGGQIEMDPQAYEARGTDLQWWASPVASRSGGI